MELVEDLELALVKREAFVALAVEELERAVQGFLRTAGGFAGRRVEESQACVKSKFRGAFVLNRRIVLHAIDATPARWRGNAGSSLLDRASTAASSPG